MRCTQLTQSYVESIQREVYHQTGTQMDDYEETEQVFSRKDRKAYREAIKQRTEAQRTVTQPETRSLGKAKQARSKTSR